MTGSRPPANGETRGVVFRALKTVCMPADTVRKIPTGPESEYTMRV